MTLTVQESIDALDAAKKQRRYIVTRRPYYPSMAEITEAFKWLADRGFGQAPKTVQIEGSVTTGFKMVFRRWAPGTDPASLPLAEMPKSIVGSSKVLDFPCAWSGKSPRIPGHRTSVSYGPIRRARTRSSS